MKNKYILKNWSFTISYMSLFAQGNVYNNPKFKYGTYIHTSRVLDMKLKTDHIEVETKNSIYCIYPDDIDKELEQEKPGFYQDLYKSIQELECTE